MSRRKRRGATVIMVNPRGRRRRNPSRALSRRRRNPSRHVRRRRNPGGGFGSFVKTYFKVGVPALLTSGAVGFADAKLLASLSATAVVLIKLGATLASTLLVRRFPLAGTSVVASLWGSLGYVKGFELGGGVCTVPTAPDATKKIAALIRSDPRAMGVLAKRMQAMGASRVDETVRLSGMRGNELGHDAMSARSLAKGVNLG